VKRGWSGVPNQSNRSKAPCAKAGRVQGPHWPAPLIRQGQETINKYVSTYTNDARNKGPQFKQQNFLELLHHQWKAPLAVRPLFLKSPRRVEALVSLLQLAPQAHQVLERRYRQTLAPDAPAAEQRMTAEALLRQFQVYGLIVHPAPVGRVVHATRATSRQRHILTQLGFPTPAQILVRKLPPDPT
jgi:hypothetical protein